MAQMDVCVKAATARLHVAGRDRPVKSTIGAKVSGHLRDSDR
jgi:hypothetical protein